MEWLQNITWAPHGVMLSTLSNNQSQLLRPVSELQAVIAENVTNPIKTKSRTAFSSWRKLTTEETIALAYELGFQASDSGQSFYTFEADNRRHIIPTGVLMCSMFRPFNGIAKYLFAPQGLDNLCMPHGNSEKPEMMFFKHPRKATGMQEGKAQGIINSLSWMHCFQSARQMWSSVFEYAKQGKLDLKLPAGEIDFLCSGRALKSGDILISEFRIRLLCTNETPIEAFSSHTQTIEFERVLHKISAPKKSSIPMKYKSIPLRDGNWVLTDVEWQAVKMILILKNGAGTEEKVRRIVNLQLQKLAQGVRWPTVAPEPSEQITCRTYLWRFKVDGRWDIFIGKLTELRQAA